MAYTKIDWNETTTPMSTDNLDNMETIYDEGIAGLSGVRADDSEELLCYIVSSFPTASTNTGYIIFNTTTEFFYYSDGTDWQFLALAGEASI